MSEIPRVTGREAIRAFERCGFAVIRIKGSHHIMGKGGHDGRLSIPMHGNECLGVGLLGKLIKVAGITVEKFCESL